jgi:hypothetical protein
LSFDGPSSLFSTIFIDTIRYDIGVNLISNQSVLLLKSHILIDISPNPVAHPYYYQSPPFGSACVDGREASACLPAMRGRHRQAGGRLRRAHSVICARVGRGTAGEDRDKCVCGREREKQRRGRMEGPGRRAARVGVSEAVSVGLAWACCCSGSSLRVGEAGERAGREWEGSGAGGAGSGAGKSVGGRSLRCGRGNRGR